MCYPRRDSRATVRASVGVLRTSELLFSQIGSAAQSEVGDRQDLVHRRPLAAALAKVRRRASSLGSVQILVRHIEQMRIVVDVFNPELLHHGVHLLRLIVIAV